VKEILERGKIEYLVCKHIYGMKDFAISYEDAARCLAYAVDFLVKLELKIFIPAFSIGRTQEVLTIINTFCRTKPRIIVNKMTKSKYLLLKLL